MTKAKTPRRATTGNSPRQPRRAASAFEAGSFSVLPKQPETRTSPTFVSKKPVYTKLPFSVTARGDLASLIDWLERFYKLQLLHQIRQLTIQVPAGADSTARRGQN